jgi:hypothetical protein
MHGKIVDKTTDISPSTVLSRCHFDVFISVSVRKSSSHKLVIKNGSSILIAILAVAWCYSFGVNQNVSKEFS